MRTTLALFACLVIVAPAANAVDLPTNALVEIVAGIEVQETTKLNFGILVLKTGTVVIPATGAPYTDASVIVYDDTNLCEGGFQVQSAAGTTVELDCTVIGGSLPDGLSLTAFTAEWANAGVENPVPHARLLEAATEVLKIGASLSINQDLASPTVGPIDLPYTVSVSFP